MPETGPAGFERHPGVAPQLNTYAPVPMGRYQPPRDGGSNPLTHSHAACDETIKVLVAQLAEIRARATAAKRVTANAWTLNPAEVLAVLGEPDRSTRKTGAVTYEHTAEFSEDGFREHFRKVAGDSSIKEVHIEWAVAYGGEDGDNCAGVLYCDDEADAREHLQWTLDSFLVRREVAVGQWIRVDDAGTEPPASDAVSEPQSPADPPVGDCEGGDSGDGSGGFPRPAVHRGSAASGPGGEQR